MGVNKFLIYISNGKIFKHKVVINPNQSTYEMTIGHNSPPSLRTTFPTFAERQVTLSPANNDSGKQA